MIEHLGRAGLGILRVAGGLFVLAGVLGSIFWLTHNMWVLTIRFTLWIGLLPLSALGWLAALAWAGGLMVWIAGILDKSGTRTVVVSR